MKKDKKIIEKYTVEITVSGWTDAPSHFRKLAKEQIKEIYIDSMSVGISGSSCVKSKNVKIIKVEEVNKKCHAQNVVLKTGSA